MTARYELITKFEVIVDLSVEKALDGAVFARERLVARLKVDNRQSLETDVCECAAATAVGVGPSVVDRAHHPVNDSMRPRLMTLVPADTGYSTHRGGLADRRRKKKTPRAGTRADSGVGLNTITTTFEPWVRSARLLFRSYTRPPAPPAASRRLSQPAS